jgi:hypothetical protein
MMTLVVKFTVCSFVNGSRIRNPQSFAFDTILCTQHTGRLLLGRRLTRGWLRSGLRCICTGFKSDLQQYFHGRNGYLTSFFSYY